MAVNKVIYDGDTLVDLTDSTVTPETLAEGVIAYNAKGERIVGTATFGGTGLISFTIDGTSYQADQGMTWGAWVTSSYNTDNYVVSPQYGVIHPNYSDSVAVYPSTSSTEVYSRDAIMSGGQYQVLSW